MKPSHPSLGTYTDDGSPVLIDLARLLVTRMLIQANSGGGKSRALRRLFEVFAGLVQQLIIATCAPPPAHGRDRDIDGPLRRGFSVDLIFSLRF